MLKDYFTGNVEHSVIFSGVLLITLLIGFVVSRLFKRMVESSTFEMKNDPTNYLFLGRAIVALVYLVGIGVAIYTVPPFRAMATTILAGAGILAVAVGFASKQAFSNIVSGVFIVIFKPFRVNDRLRVRELSGVVEDITLRHTVIRDLENKRIIIPNTVISDEIIVNSDFADDNICKWIEISISYDSDIKLARKIIKDEIISHPLSVDPRSPEQINAGDELAPVKVIDLAEYSVNLRAWAWAKSAPDAFFMGCDLLESIKERFEREGVEIPYPHRTIVQKQGGNTLSDLKT